MTKKLLVIALFTTSLLLMGGLPAYIVHPVASASQETNKSPDNLWTEISDSIDSVNTLRAVTKLSTFRLNQDALRSLLNSAPTESLAQQKNDSPIIIYLPLPDKSYTRFRIQKRYTDPKLAAQFPQITSYNGTGIDDPGASAVLQLTPQGLHVMVLSSGRAFYVDPAVAGAADRYVSYFKDDLKQQDTIRCLVNERINRRAKKIRPKKARRRTSFFTSFDTGDNSLRIYRIAVAATGEYVAAIHRLNNPQGPQSSLAADAYAAIERTITRVSNIYQRELGIRLNLISDEAKIIYTDAATDPYPFGNNDADKAFTENQANLDKVIGVANYDIGHVFTTGSGGLAQPQSACDTGSNIGGVTKVIKAWGTTGRADPVGDPFDVDFVAHEIGHQLGAHHTFNSTIDKCGHSNRNASTAYEPGSGSTIMAYAAPNKPCGNETVQEHSDDYFHEISLEEISDYASDDTPGYGGSCPRLVPTNNHPPTVNGGPDYTVPQNTPFTLMAKSGSDVDNDLLKYTWEEFDKTSDLPGNPSARTPIFRSRPSRQYTPKPCPLPSPSPAASPIPTPTPVPVMWRTFPILTNILTPPAVNVYTAEALPTTARLAKFRVTVRDDHGRFGMDEVIITTITETKITTSMGPKTVKVGPFSVLTPKAGEEWQRGKPQTVTWDVANTNLDPVKCANVRIILLINGDDINDCDGTDPVVLLDSTPNNGKATVTIPSNVILTDKARIKVEAVDNIFFNVTPGDFKIIDGEH
jgi:hypothetical protein